MRVLIRNNDDIVDSYVAEDKNFDHYLNWIRIGNGYGIVADDIAVVEIKFKSIADVKVGREQGEFSE